MSVSWLGKLKAGLNKSSQKISGGITDIFVKRRLDNETLSELEELLISADIGAKGAADLIAQLRAEKFDKEITPEEIKQALAAHIEKMLAPYARPLSIDEIHKPHIVLVAGVNGTGKTTTIGKLASTLQKDGNRVMLAAADTFRAAAVEQLKIWGERNDCPVISGLPNADPASVAFTACEQAQAQKMSILLIDSAGRLQNKANLMAELQKIVKVIQKHDAAAPHSVLLVLDATTGQNAISQVEIFKQAVNVTGLIITKLDGSARGGVVVALARKFALPIYAIGVGEGIDDLRPFSAHDFAKNLVGAS